MAATRKKENLKEQPSAIDGGRKKGGGKAGKKKKAIDWADDAHFDKNRALVYIEHTEECPIFKTKAIEFSKFLESKYPGKTFQLIRNETPPRDGAFEIYFGQNARTDRILLWSGVDKGPPRRDKFPETFDILLPEANYILNKPYVEVKNTEENEFDDEPSEEPPPIQDNQKAKKSDKGQKKRRKAGESRLSSAGSRQPAGRSSTIKIPTINTETKTKKPLRKAKRLNETKSSLKGIKKIKGTGLLTQ